jgi:hypothetical protein
MSDALVVVELASMCIWLFSQLAIDGVQALF